MPCAVLLPSKEQAKMGWGPTFVCSSKELSVCSRCHSEFSTSLCDYPIGEGKTCDAPLCDSCRVRISDLHDIDLCPTHAIIERLKANTEG